MINRTIDQFYNEAHESVKKPANRRLPYWMIFVSLGVSNMGDAAEIGSMGLLLSNDGFLNELVGGYEGIVASALYAGMLLGGIAAGPLCDQTGRRNVLLYGLLLNSSFGVAAAITTQVWQLVICRLLMGFGVGSIVSCLLALTSEHTPPMHRGRYLNFVSAFWTIGSIYVAVVALVLFGLLGSSWRLYVFVNALPSMLSFGLVLCFVPESARFLAIHGKLQKATGVANRIASSMGFTGDRLDLEEIKSHYNADMTSKSVVAAPSDVEQDKPEGRRASSWKLFKRLTDLYQADIRSRMIGVQSLWFCLSFGSGICLWMTRLYAELSFVDHVYTMTLFFALASVPGVFIAGHLMDRVGRTLLLWCSLIFTMSSLLVFSLLSFMSDIGWLVVLFSCLFHSALVVSWSTVSVVTAEVFPTQCRSTAMGLCAACGRVASITVHLVAAPLIETERTSLLMLAGTGAFMIATVVSMVAGIQDKTGEPLQDVDEPKATKHTAKARGVFGFWKRTRRISHMDEME